MQSSSTDENSFNVHIRQFKNYNIFLKISAITINSTSEYRRNEIRKIFKDQLQRNLREETLKRNKDALYVAHITDDDEYERCKVVSIDNIGNIAYVRLIDVGDDHVPVSYHQVLLRCVVQHLLLALLRPIDPSSEFHNLTPFCDDYYLAGIHFNRNLKIGIFQQLLRDLKIYFKENAFAKLTVLSTGDYGSLASLSFNDCTFLTTHLINSSIKLDYFQTVENDKLIKMINDYNEFKGQQQIKPIARNLKPAAPPKFSRIAPLDGEEESHGTFKCNVFAAQSIHKVRISHYETGVNLFYVQMEIADSKLQQLTTSINGIQLKNLNKRPSSLGMACLARYNKKIYRVAVAKSSNIQKNDNYSYFCHFVDFGFSAFIKFDSLFYIPQEILKVNAFAAPFSLTGLSNVNFQANADELKYYFREITENKLLTLKCANLDGPPICQYCEIYDNEINILNLLKIFSPSTLKYPTQEKLDASKSYIVKVCYINSVQEFFIQNEDATFLLNYDTQYYELEKRMPNSPILQQLKINQCCGVQIDSEWFRGKIIGINNNIASVLIIDFGIIEELPVKSIHLLTKKFANTPSFAYRCCLKGFENGNVSENINTQFDIFCSDGKGDRRAFKMQIVDFDDNKGYIVELDDESVRPPANVNKILLKNSRPLAETITLENAKKRQKEKQQAPPTLVPEITKEIKNSERNRSASQRGGRSGSKGSSRKSTPAFDESNDPRKQRTHFDKQNTASKNDGDKKTGTYFQTPKEANLAASSEKQSKKLKPSNSSSSFESNNAANDKDKQSPRKVKTSSPEKKQQKAPKTSSPIKREKSNVEKKNFKSGWVSVLCNVNEAYVHFEECIENLEKLLNEIFLFYETNEGYALKKSEAGTVCAFKNDGNWFSGEIKHIKGDTYNILNHQYGSLELVKKSNIRRLDVKFSNTGRVIDKVYFAIKPISTDVDELTNKMNEIFKSSNEMKFEMIKKFKDGWLVDVIDTKSKSSLFEEFITKKLAVRIKNEDELEKRLEEARQNQKFDDFDELVEPEPNIILENDEEVEEKEKEEEEVKQTTKNVGKITALTSPTDFYLVVLEDLDLFMKIHTNIQILAPALSPLLDFECGTLCLAQQPFDNLWYRAKIIDSDVTIITVLCVDNGKTFSIENKISLKILPEQLQRKEFFGISCSLPINIERASEEKATEIMLKLVDANVEFEIVLLTPDKTYIDVFYENQNITQQLIEMDLAKELEIFQSGLGYTSHINSLGDFYIQLEDDQLKLDLIAAILEDANGKFEKIENPKIGDIVAAKFSDDGMWYRAIIEEINGNRYLVKFIDYGNIGETKEIGVLNKSITELPQMVKHCRLSMPRNVVGFSEAAQQKFIEICANGATVLQIKVIKPGNVTEVEIFCDGKNIMDSLASLCNIHDNNNDDY